MFYTGTTLRSHLHNTETFCTEFNSAGGEGGLYLVMKNETESCVAGNIDSGITSPTREVLL